MLSGQKKMKMEINHGAAMPAERARGIARSIRFLPRNDQGMSAAVVSGFWGRIFDRQRRGQPALRWGE
jgi:hypothetical protein